MNEQALLEKLRKIDALMARPGSPGEGAAAAGARLRLLERLATTNKTDPPIEFRFTMSDQWSRHLFLALLRHYDLRPYRQWGQRHSTVMVRVSRTFVDQTLWPEFIEMSTALHGYLEDVTHRVICEIFHQKPEEAEEAPAQLAGPAGAPGS